MPIARFEELIAWQKARDLALMVYRATNTGRFARDFALRDQIRRAAVSVMSNIALLAALHRSTLRGPRSRTLALSHLLSGRGSRRS